MTQGQVEAVVLDVLLEHLDEDWAIPCCTKKPLGCGGERAAQWIMYGALCCAVPKTSFYCTPCKDMLLTNPGGILCMGCHTLHWPASSAFRLIEPLNP